MDETFETILSNGVKVELCRGGKDMKVTKQNLDEYIKLILEKRFSENKS